MVTPGPNTITSAAELNAALAEVKRLRTDLERLQQISPLIRRPAYIVDYDPGSRHATWIGKEFALAGGMTNDRFGIIGTPAWMPAMPLGNGDFSTVVLPLPVWLNHRIFTADHGDVWDFDWNCCTPPTPASGGPGCCGGTADIPLTIAGSGDDCPDCLPLDLTLTWDADSERWKGEAACTIGDCEATFHAMLQCYECADPPDVPDDIPDCDVADFYYILTVWVTYAGDDCPAAQYATLTWTNEEAACGPFALTPKSIDLGLDCDMTVRSGSDVTPIQTACCPEPIASTLYATIATDPACGMDGIVVTLEYIGFFLCSPDVAHAYHVWQGRAAVSACGTLAYANVEFQCRECDIGSGFTVSLSGSTADGSNCTIFENPACAGNPTTSNCDPFLVEKEFCWQDGGSCNCCDTPDTTLTVTVTE